MKDIKKEIKIFGKTIYFKDKPLTKERIFNMYWLWDARQARGSGYLNELRLTTYVPVVGVIMLLFPKIPKIAMPIFVLAFFILTYTIGYIDEKKIGYWQYDNEKQKTYKTNPYERRIEKRLVKIENKLKIKSEEMPYE